MKKIQDANIKNKKILVRVDFNVPVKGTEITSDERLEVALPTIKYLLEGGAMVALCSHFGKPEGKKDPKFSLAIVLPTLKKLIGRPVTFVPDCIGPARDQIVAKAQPGDLLLFENVRFHPGEEENDPEYAAALAKGFDLYVNNAFGESHRKYSSIVGVPKILPAFAGLLVQDEIKHLDILISGPAKPYVAISGGAKISDKIEVLKALIEKIDVLLIGGAMANTFLAAEGYEVGKSLYEEDFLSEAEEVNRMAEDRGVELMLPDDVVVAKSLSEKSTGKVKSLDEVDKSDLIVDLGPKTIAKYSEPIKFAGTIFWNGPLGVDEIPDFSKGTSTIAKIVAESKANSFIGGGDTVAAVADLNLNFDFVSSGGGATLEYVSGQELPGLKALE